MEATPARGVLGNVQATLLLSLDAALRGPKRLFRGILTPVAFDEFLRRWREAAAPSNCQPRAKKSFLVLFFVVLGIGGVAVGRIARRGRRVQPRTKRKPT